MLLTNSDFRIFLSDLNTVGREVFRDTAFTLSNVSKKAAKKIDPSPAERKALKEPGADEALARSAEELNGEVAEVAKVVGNGVAKVAKRADVSLAEKLQGEEGESLLFRLKKTITNLRQKRDYNDSVSVLATLLKRYALAYSRTVEDAMGTLEADVEPNREMEKAVKNFWTFLSSFGDKEEWNKLEPAFHKVLDHSRKDPEFEDLLIDVGHSQILISLTTSTRSSKSSDRRPRVLVQSHRFARMSTRFSCRLRAHSWQSPRIRISPR